MNRLVLNAASSLLHSLWPASLLDISPPPPCPHLLFSSLPPLLPSPLRCAGNGVIWPGRKEESVPVPRHVTSARFCLFTGKMPPFPSLGGSWRVVRGNHSGFFFFYSS